MCAVSLARNQFWPSHHDSMHSLVEMQHVQHGITGWPQSSRKKFPELSRAINLLFHRLSQQKVNVIMTVIKGHDDHVYPVNSCLTQIFE